MASDNALDAGVSVVIPMRNEEKFIGICLESVFATTYPNSRLEILVVDGESADRSAEIVAGLARTRPNLKLLRNPKKTAPAAMNVGLAAASGAIIVRMDAHAVYAPDYIEQCVRLLGSSGAANVGGAQNAVGADYTGETIAVATTVPFGIGDAQYRFAKDEKWVDTVFLGAWKKETLDALGGFNEDWVVNQDYELNVRIRKAGGKILFSPAIKCRYFVRSSLPKLAKQYFRYGYWKVKTLRTYPESARWRQLVPPLFVAGFLASVLLLALGHSWGWALPGAYAAANACASLLAAKRRGWKHLPALPFVFFLLHSSWGVGFWCGTTRFGFPRFSFRGFLSALKPVAAPVLMLCCAWTALAAPSGKSPAAPPGPVHRIGGCPVFPANDPWNVDVSTLPADPRSEEIIGYAARHEKDPLFHIWSAGSPLLGFAYNVVSATQPAVDLLNQVPYHRWNNPWGPIPADPALQRGSLDPTTGDLHMLIVQEGACKLYESYSTKWDPQKRAWSAYTQTVWDLARASYPDQRGPAGVPSADASGMPMTQGIIDYEELAAGAITHALRFQMPNSTISNDRYVPPATSAGAKKQGSPEPGALMYGSRLRLKAGFDPARLSTPEGRIIAIALKRYGMFLADGACCNSFSLFRDARLDPKLSKDIENISITDFEVLPLPPAVKY